jgi:hypothetical protein
MIGTIRRHQKWLWMVVIAATIITFVYAFSPNRKYGGSDQDMADVNFGSINGEPITRDQFLDAEREGRILYRLNAGEWPDSEDKKKDLLRIAVQRLLLDAALEDYHITVTPEATARYTRQLFGIKPGDAVPPDKILEELNKLTHEGGVTLDDFDRFARHQAGQEYLMALTGMSGKLITPTETEVFYRRENAPMEMELVSFSATNYYPAATPAEKDIEDFYTKRQADYRLPDRIQVNYIAFAASNYLAGVEKKLGTNLNEQVDQDYLQAGSAAFKDASGSQLSAEAAKAKIKKQILQYTALTEARKDAINFLTDLSQGRDDQHPYSPGDLAALAATKHLTVKTSEPFDLKTTPKDLAVPAKALRVLFSLRDDDPDDKERSMIYASSPLVGEDAVYVAGLKARIPSAIQPLSAVHDKVIEDYRQNMALESAKAAGTRFEKALADGMALGKTFDTMCAAQFVRPRILTPFSLTTTSIPEVPEKARFQQLQDIAGRMRAGQYSPFIPTADGGFLLYFMAQLPVDEAAMRRDLPAYLARMRERFQIAAYNAWFSKQAQAHYVPPPTGDLSAPGG